MADLKDASTVGWNYSSATQTPVRVNISVGAEEKLLEKEIPDDVEKSNKAQKRERSCLKVKWMK